MRHFLIFLYAAATLAAANPSFHSPQSYYAGEPLFVGSGDLNGDGKPDMVVVNVGGPLQTLLNNGDGTFSPSATISITTPIAFAIGDFNGDGKLDVAIMSEDPVQSVNVYLGDGHGGFTTSKQTSFGMMPTSMAAGDVNGDGILDVVFGSFESNQVGVALGNGDGSFKSPQFIATGEAGWQIQLADVNHDGKLDVSYLSSLSGVSTLITQLGNGNGTFGSQVSFTIAGTVASTAFVFADLDGDGTLDVVLAGSTGSSWQAYVGHGNGNGTFSILGNTALPTAPTNLVVGDFNEDGHPDLAGNGSTSSGGDLMVLLSNGSGSLAAPLIYASDGSGPLATGDWNGDGHLDLALANTFADTITTPFGDGHGHFMAPIRPSAGTWIVSAATGDLNGDGKVDMVVVNQNTNQHIHQVSILIGKGNGAFGAPIVLSNVGQIPTAVAIADLNHDGIPDLVVTDTKAPSGLRVLLGTGGSFQSPVFYACTKGSQVLIADVNGDGFPDLIVLGTAHAVVDVLLGNGDGTFHAAQGFAAGVDPVAMVAGDFNGDGHVDLALADATGNAVLILLGNGDGTFGSPVTAASVPMPHSLVAADFNEDGNIDLAVSSQTTGALEYLAGNGNGTFAAPLSFTAPGNASELVAADINGDGHMDVVYSATSGAQFSAMLGNGAGGFEPSAMFDSGGAAAIALGADFNGDGKPDLAFVGGIVDQPYYLTVVLNTTH